MKVCAVIAEFNPFHAGHRYLFEKIRDFGYTHIVVIMSGNFVQRGEPAVFPKYVRAKHALEMGADLVLELPTVKVLSTAEKYAFSALSLVKNLGSVVDGIAFGIQSDGLGSLVKIKNALENEEFSPRLKKYLGEGLSFACSRQRAVEEVLGSSALAEKIKSPNNILALEYLKAMDKLGLSLYCHGVKRMEESGKYLSATAIRELIFRGSEEFKRFIPQNLDLPLELRADYFSAQRAVLSRLRSLEKEQIASLPDVSEGLENRIYKAIKTSVSLQDLLLSAKAKRYTLSRIKRIVLCGFLGITSPMAEAKVPYIRVLGSREKGFEVLKNVDFPLVTKYSDALRQGKNAKNFFEAENKFTNLYSTLTSKILPCEEEKTFKMIVK